MLRIAVFGSAFNPPTLGHQSVIESLSHFDRILLVPSIAHAWGKLMLPYPVRCQLVDAFIGDLGNPAIVRSDIEEQLYQPELHVTTHAVLQALQVRYPADELTFVVGPDNLLQFGSFYKADEILQQFSVLACPEKVPVRSTVIRQQIRQGKPISQMTTPSVEKLIQDLSLYCADT
ncbi:nicotinate-nicotinamide nucleotide adenylyltransferase [Vibrio quintilis]|uniref:nicotinate-nucleotide adenylyltransferase n=1 Tax=Vibrio quintilis TaxID=1117707 RepID=A0A1M7YWT6_9VIBR|nr:nicotinate-nicotinamide nucleotide adenylyltransferase [Vibrio quintilis]SHO56956.1 Nicotinate-nucleotide adenylyltransferase [Vibrio quintilis]